MEGVILFNSIMVVLSIVAIIVLTSKFKFNVFASLFLVAFALALLTTPFDRVIDLLKSSFGSTMGGIAFVIIFGTTIAICMEKSGAVYSIATHILKSTGKKNAKRAMAFTGFIPGLTIFCDTGFIILSGIAKSFSAQSKTAMPLMAAILACSLYSAHCLVPTHPGSLGAAVELKANLGYLVFFGAIIAIPGTLAAYLWANFMTKDTDYPAEAIDSSSEKNEEMASIESVELPSFINSLIPVLLPLILVSLSTLALVLGIKEGAFAKTIHFIGNPVMALFIGVIAGLWLLKRYTKKEVITNVLEEAISKAGPILIITAGGGMFGSVIRETGVGNVLSDLLGGASISIFVPFILAALLKTAQGSSTVAALTTAGIIAPIIGDLGLDSEMGRVLAVLSLGAGSAMVSHANDSFFWVVTKFSNIEVNQSLRVFTSSTFVMGITMFVCVWITSLIVL